jgi:hypothetical protein
MENPGARRQQIKDLLSSIPAGEPGSALVTLLPPLRLQVASLVSEEGFNFLLERTIFLTAQSFQWINGEPASSAETELDNLRAKLATRTHEDALAASTFLLSSFVDLVASLIGDSLTDGIVRSAWGDDALGTLGEENQT